MNTETMRATLESMLGTNVDQDTSNPWRTEFSATVSGETLSLKASDLSWMESMGMELHVNALGSKRMSVFIVLSN